MVKVVIPVKVACIPLLITTGWGLDYAPRAIPVKLQHCFSEETAKQIKRMLAWAAARVAELEEARLQPQAAPPQPPSQPSQEGPRVRGSEGPSLALLPRLPPAAFDGAVLARAAALAAGPRVGVSPTSVMQHE